jgi:hypothetical protein
MQALFKAAVNFIYQKNQNLKFKHKQTSTAAAKRSGGKCGKSPLKRTA